MKKIFRDITHPVIWDQSLTTLGESTLNNLFKALEEYEFAIFVFGGEDKASIRNEQTSIVRDNVIFETGLFMGRLGKERVFFVKPEKVDLHLPTDLMGITYGHFDPDHPNKNASLRTFCNQVKSQIKNSYIPVIPDEGIYGINILKKDLDYVKSNSSPVEIMQTYGLYVNTSASQTIKLILENFSTSPNQNVWYFNTVKIQGWLPTTYNGSQEFILNENSRGILNIYFVGKGNATIKAFLNNNPEPFLQKEIHWG